MSSDYCFFCVGTGGHVLPAKNLIVNLLNSGVEKENITVVTDKRGVKYFQELDLDIIQKNFFISSSGMFGYLINTGQFIKTAWSVFKQLKAKNIDTVLTTGAYIAPYAALISLFLRSKFFIQEQNQYAGLGNKVASYFPSTVFSSFPNTQNIRKANIIFTGPILNMNLKIDKTKIASDPFTIGIQGGSQGSKELNEFLYKFLESHSELDTKFIHITGPNKMSNKFTKPENYYEYEFIEDMSSYYEEIDFQVSRSGGGSLEAAYLSIPQLLIPYKHGTTSSHQLLNAKYLEDIKNAMIVQDYSEFAQILKNVCMNKRNYLIDNFKSPNIKVGNNDIFKIITSGKYEKI